MVKIEKNYGYMGPGDGDKRYYMTEGQYMSGQTIGIMLLSGRFLFFPGNVSNAETFDFPVRYLEIGGVHASHLHANDRTIVSKLIETAKQLEIDGCRAVCANCGYFGNFQAEVAANVDIPVYLSAIVQVPWILTGLRKSQKLGILCAVRDTLTMDLFESCGVTKEQHARCVIHGLQDAPEFSILCSEAGHLNHKLMRDDLVNAAEKLVAENPDIGAILLECTDMPPYAAAIQNAVNLPVFDSITLINYIHSGVARKPYYGFM